LLIEAVNNPYRHSFISLPECDAGPELIDIERIVQNGDKRVRATPSTAAKAENPIKIGNCVRKCGELATRKATEHLGEVADRTPPNRVALGINNVDQTSLRRHKTGEAYTFSTLSQGA
jgi:hypothetical protein